MRIFLVEDNVQLGEAIVKLLQQAQYHIDWVRLAAEAEALISTEACDLLILDLGLPDGEGLDLLRHFRRKHTTPVMILTARSAPHARVKGLDLGADDYLIKPFDIEEFEARVRALLRRQSTLSSAVTTLGALEIDLARHRVSAGSAEIPMTSRDFQLLRLFLSHMGKTLSKAHIQTGLASFDDYLSDNAVEQTVSRLRRKLEPYGLHIHTARGIGYFLDEER